MPVHVLEHSQEVRVCGKFLAMNCNCFSGDALRYFSVRVTPCEVHRSQHLGGFTMAVASIGVEESADYGQDDGLTIPPLILQAVIPTRRGLPTTEVAFNEGISGTCVCEATRLFVDQVNSFAIGKEPLVSPRNDVMPLPRHKDQASNSV